MALYKAKKISLQRQLDAALQQQSSALSALQAAEADLLSMVRGVWG